MTRSEAFRARVLEDYDLSESDSEILVEVCRMLDLLEALQAVVDSDGPMLDGKAHPAVVELRQQRVVLGRLLRQLDLPDGVYDEEFERPSTTRAKKAANTRWGR